VIDAINITKRAKKKASTENTYIHKSKKAVSVKNTPIEVSRLKYFLKIRGGIVVPPLEALLWYRMAKAIPSNTPPIVIESNVSYIIISRGVYLMAMGKSKDPSIVLKNTSLSRNNKVTISSRTLPMSIIVLRSM